LLYLTLFPYTTLFRSVKLRRLDVHLQTAGSYEHFSANGRTTASCFRADSSLRQSAFCFRAHCEKRWKAMDRQVRRKLSHGTGERDRKSTRLNSSQVSI